MNQIHCLSLLTFNNNSFDLDLKSQISEIKILFYEQTFWCMCSWKFKYSLTVISFSLSFLFHALWFFFEIFLFSLLLLKLSSMKLRPTIGDRRRITRTFDSSTVQQEFYWPGCKLLILNDFVFWSQYYFRCLVFHMLWFSN